MKPRLPAPVVAALAGALLAACGGGGSPQDVRPGDPPPEAVVTGPDAFLLFPNPQVQPDGTLQTDTAAYAEAYYAAIDPGNARDTLAKFRSANGFDSGSGTQAVAVFGDRRDLGYGRRMTARQNADGSLAFIVENYLVEVAAGYAYSTLNLDAAVARDPRYLIGVNAIEVSAGPAGGARFAKFFNFNGQTGARELAVDLDGRGPKFMPGPCITCHGGRGDALTPPDAAGKPRFNLVQGVPSAARGDVQARLHPFEVDAFDFSPRAGFTRADQEAALKTINRMVLCSYPLPTPSPHPEDACRPQAETSEWQGSGSAIIKAAYGGDGLPSPTFDDRYMPPSWEEAGQSTLYREVVAPHCRVCHLMRGTGAQSDVDFGTYEKFRQNAARTRAHVFDRGNMPLAKIVYDAFWSSPAPDILANFLQGQGYAVRDPMTGAVPRPGKPVADPGPDRVVLPGATRLSAAGSLYASSYAWSIVAGPPGAQLANAGTAEPTFTAPSEGTWTLQLVAGDGTRQSAPAQVKVVVKAGLSPAPADIRFQDIRDEMKKGLACTSCHSDKGALPRPPVYYTDTDRNGDGVIDATDEAWFHAEVRSRINFTDIAASPLLRKPAGISHGGRLVAGFDASAPPGDPARAKYDLFLNWILAGAPL